ncbi:hypothetical protein ABIA35_002896 [Catenulispora sp. MAP12-49]|uniref:hypothetical protein n=1 Tax=Catenulispora sp. MAP12-49 TaxID=3156302 RepID=UPI003511B35C
MRDDLPHAMRETARKLEPDVVRLAAGGVTRGTRMRRVERAVQVLGSALAVAVVFAGVTFLEPHRTSGDGSRGGEVNQPAASAPGNAFGTATPGAPDAPNSSATNPSTPDPDPSTPDPGATTPDATVPSSTGNQQISDDELDATLKSCLAGTGVSGRGYVAFAGTTTVSAQITAGNDVGFIAIVVSAPGAARPGRGAPQLLADGSVAYVSEGPGTSDGRHADKTELTVTLVRTDGASLTALETNSSSEKSAAAPGAPLLLSDKQVLAVLDNPAWDAAAAAASASQNSAWGNSPQDTLATALPPSVPNRR